jgi:hypothetical protein
MADVSRLVEWAVAGKLQGGPCMSLDFALGVGYID